MNGQVKSIDVKIFLVIVAIIIVFVALYINHLSSLSLNVHLDEHSAIDCITNEGLLKRCVFSD